MNQNLSFSFIGGDPRQIEVASKLAHEGYTVYTFGLEKACFSKEYTIVKSESLNSCIECGEIVVLPLPYRVDHECINTTFSDRKINLHDILRQMNRTQILLVGRADEKLRNLSAFYGINMIDYGEREELLIQNAIPTVEGALEIAMKETKFTIHGSNCLVLGYGRIGKILAKSLQALGAFTTVAARKQRDYAWISVHGCQCISFSDLVSHIGKYDIIFNTVPSLVVDYQVLSEMPDNTLIIDLASKPGGVDFETAKKLNKKVIWALSLPGKVAPESAGTIIKETILNILKELGV